MKKLDSRRRRADRGARGADRARGRGPPAGLPVVPRAARELLGVLFAHLPGGLPRKLDAEAVCAVEGRVDHPELRAGCEAQEGPGAGRDLGRGACRDKTRWTFRSFPEQTKNARPGDGSRRRAASEITMMTTDLVQRNDSVERGNPPRDLPQMAICRASGRWYWCVVRFNGFVDLTPVQSVLADGFATTRDEAVEGAAAALDVDPREALLREEKDAYGVRGWVCGVPGRHRRSVDSLGRDPGMPRTTASTAPRVAQDRSRAARSAQQSTSRRRAIVSALDPVSTETSMLTGTLMMTEMKTVNLVIAGVLIAIA